MNFYENVEKLEQKYNETVRKELNTLKFNIQNR